MHQQLERRWRSPRPSRKAAFAVPLINRYKAVRNSGTLISIWPDMGCKATKSPSRLCITGLGAAALNAQRPQRLDPSEPDSVHTRQRHDPGQIGWRMREQNANKTQGLPLIAAFYSLFPLKWKRGQVCQNFKFSMKSKINLNLQIKLQSIISQKLRAIATLGFSRTLLPCRCSQASWVRSRWHCATREVFLGMGAAPNGPYMYPKGGGVGKEKFAH